MNVRHLYRRSVKIYKKDGLSFLIAKIYRYILQYVSSSKISKTLISPKLKQLISNSPLLCTFVFYFCRNFHYEKKSILKGQVMYDNHERQKKKPIHRLNRLTHLLEKGLIYDDRRCVFGTEKAIELVSLVEAAWDTRKNPESDNQLQWTIDVLYEYFEVVNTNDTLSEAEKQFREFLDNNEITNGDRSPQQRRDVVTNGVSYGQLQQLAIQRSSTRHFEDKEVPHKLLDKAISIAAKSPSACNRQSYEFRIYDDPEIINNLMELPVGTGGFNRIPCYIVLVGKQRAYFKSEEKNVIFIDASLAAMSFEFALETLGLASCTVNWPARHTANKKISNILDLDPDEVVVTTIVVGYPQETGGIPYSEKKSVDQIRSYNKN